MSSFFSALVFWTSKTRKNADNSTGLVRAASMDVDCSRKNKKVLEEISSNTLEKASKKGSRMGSRRSSRPTSPLRKTESSVASFMCITDEVMSSTPACPRNGNVTSMKASGSLMEPQSIKAKGNLCGSFEEERIMLKRDPLKAAEAGVGSLNLAAKLTDELFSAAEYYGEKHNRTETPQLKVGGTGGKGSKKSRNFPVPLPTPKQNGISSGERSAVLAKNATVGSGKTEAKDGKEGRVSPLEEELRGAILPPPPPPPVTPVSKDEPEAEAEEEAAAEEAKVDLKETLATFQASLRPPTKLPEAYFPLVPPVPPPRLPRAPKPRSLSDLFPQPSSCKEEGRRVGGGGGGGGGRGAGLGGGQLERTFSLGTAAPENSPTSAKPSGSSQQRLLRFGSLGRRTAQPHFPPPNGGPHSPSAEIEGLSERQLDGVMAALFGGKRNGKTGQQGGGSIRSSSLRVLASLGEQIREAVAQQEEGVSLGQEEERKEEWKEGERAELISDGLGPIVGSEVGVMEDQKNEKKEEKNERKKAKNERKEEKNEKKDDAKEEKEEGEKRKKGGDRGWGWKSRSLLRSQSLLVQLEQMKGEEGGGGEGKGGAAAAAKTLNPTGAGGSKTRLADKYFPLLPEEPAGNLPTATSSPASQQESDKVNELPVAHLRAVEEEAEKEGEEGKPEREEAHDPGRSFGDASTPEVASSSAFGPASSSPFFPDLYPPSPSSSSVVDCECVSPSTNPGSPPGTTTQLYTARSRVLPTVWGPRASPRVPGQHPGRHLIPSPLSSAPLAPVAAAEVDWVVAEVADEGVCQVSWPVDEDEEEEDEVEDRGRGVGGLLPAQKGSGSSFFTCPNHNEEEEEEDRVRGGGGRGRGGEDRSPHYLPRKAAMTPGSRGVGGGGTCELWRSHSWKDPMTSPSHGTPRGERGGHGSVNVLGRPFVAFSECFRVCSGELGRGRVGSIRMCESLATGERYACKTISKTYLQSWQDVEDVRREVASLEYMSGHPYVVQLEAVLEDSWDVHLVMELCAGGELFDRIKRRKRYSERNAAVVIRRVSDVLRKCHAMGFMHRDLKPENILLTDDDDDTAVKVIDFGVAISVTPGLKCQEMVGTPFYLAPEVINRSYGVEADVWSAGVVLYIMLCGVPPFWANSNDMIRECIIRGVYNISVGVWENISAGAKDLVKRMLTYEPQDRITANEVFDHPWIQEHLEH